MQATVLDGRRAALRAAKQSQRPLHDGYADRLATKFFRSAADVPASLHQIWIPQGAAILQDY